jgi:hypothetical protein
MGSNKAFLWQWNIKFRTTAINTAFGSPCTCSQLVVAQSFEHPHKTTCRRLTLRRLIKTQDNFVNKTALLRKWVEMNLAIQTYTTFQI